jgi:hypothetical protein
MNLSKPDTSQHKIYVGWEDSNEQYYESEEGYYDDEFSFNIYTSHNTDEVYDQAVGWIDERIENLLKHLNVGDFYISFGAAENLHSVSVKNASKGVLKTKVDNFLSEIKTIVDDTDGFEWYGDDIQPQRGINITNINVNNNNTNTNTNTMNRTDFYIIIGDTPYEAWGLDEDEATPINGGIFKDGGLCDQHIGHLFPQLGAMGLEEEMEGQLSYDGNLTKEEIVESLISMGFDARVGNLEM